MQIRSRQEAVTLGLKRYYTGKPCKYGHLEQRNTVNNGCLGCNRMWGEKTRQKILRNSANTHQVLTIKVHKEDASAILSMARDLDMARELMKPRLVDNRPDLFKMTCPDPMQDYRVCPVPGMVYGGLGGNGWHWPTVEEAREEVMRKLDALGGEE